MNLVLTAVNDTLRTHIQCEASALWSIITNHLGKYPDSFIFVRLQGAVKPLATILPQEEKETSPMPVKPIKLEFFRDSSHHYRWRLLHGNGKVLAASSEGFYNKAGAKRNLRRTCSALFHVTADQIHEA